ncbi:MAG: insulinase family protein [Gammaproteobacteria bacterium]|nr:insulinase family protein [Gammaproteobacteria bacterium]
MKKLHPTQLWLLLFTLICAIAFLMSNLTKSVNNSSGPKPAAFYSQIPSSNLKITNWQTKNKINVYFVRATELPMIDIELMFKAGSVYEPQKPGVAALTNAMLIEGTKNHSAEEISETLESIGANYGSEVSKDYSSVSLRSLTENSKFTKALTTFNDILANANFPSKNFNRVKNQTLETLKLNQQYPENISSEEFYKIIYKTHPYAIPVSGTIPAVQKITQKDLVAFYNKYYNQNTAQISIVGDVTEDQARSISEQIAVNLKTGPAASELPSVSTTNPDKITNVTKHINFPSTQTHILLGSIGIKRSDPDYFALTVGNHILGTMPLTSLLFKHVRIENGLAYSVSSRFFAMKDEGPFIINMQTRNEKASEALNISKETLANFLTHGPTSDQLDMAKQNLVGQFPLNIASNSKKLDIISTIGFYNLPLDYLDQYINNVNNVTSAEITAAFKKHIDLNNLVIVTVGDNNNQPNANSSLRANNGR